MVFEVLEIFSNEKKKKFGLLSEIHRKYMSY